MEKKSNIKSCKVISMLRRVSLKCLRNSARYVCKPWGTVIGSAHSKPGLYVEDLDSKTNIKTSMLLLPEDLIIDIFSRVSLRCLFNSARYVCKPWAGIIGSSYFVEAAKLAHSKPGIYVEDLVSKTNSYFMDIKDDLNGHFERIDLGMPPEMPEFGGLIDTCGGLLLFCCYDELLFVLNPILKCCLKVPPLPLTPRHLIPSNVPSNVIIAQVPHSAIFKLFYVDNIVVLGVRWYVLYVLKIGIDNSWKEIARIKNTDGHQYFFIHYDAPQLVYSGGNDLYLIFMKKVMVIDVDKEIIVGEYPLSSSLLLGNCLSRYFLWMENQLSCIVSVRETTRLQLYILDTDSRKWTLYDEMGPFYHVVVCGHRLEVMYKHFRFWMNGQLILQLCLNEGRKIITIHYVYNVKTRRLTKIEGIPEGIPENNTMVWLHTNTLALMPTTST